jgi:hypothetical protein
MQEYDIILDTPPVPTVNCLEVHMLVGNQFIVRTLWSLKTFWHFTRSPFYVVFHDDGSLTPSDKEILQEHFPGSDILSKEYADSVLHHELKDYPLCYEYRVKNLYGKRLFDPFIFSSHPYILMIDSDVLWYKDIDRLSKWALCGVPFYMDAGGPGFSRADWWLSERGMKPAHNFNECLVGMPTHLPIEFHVIEKIFSTILDSDEFITINGKKIPNTGVGSYEGKETTYAHLGQTAFAVMMERIGDYEVLPFKGHLAKYFWSPIWEILKIENATVYHHVWDEKYKTFFKVGVNYLLQNGFIENYKKRIDTYAHNN